MISKILWGFFSLVITSSATASDWVVKKEIPSEWINIISKIGAYNERAYQNEPHRFETSWPTTLDFERTQNSFQEKCVATGVLQETLGRLLSNSNLKIKSAVIIGKNVADYDADYFLVEIKDEVGQTYFGLSEHPIFLITGSLTAQCLSASSPARR